MHGKISRVAHLPEFVFWKGAVTSKLFQSRRSHHCLSENEYLGAKTVADTSESNLCFGILPDKVKLVFGCLAKIWNSSWFSLLHRSSTEAYQKSPKWIEHLVCWGLGNTELTLYQRSSTIVRYMIIMIIPNLLEDTFCITPHCLNCLKKDFQLKCLSLPRSILTIINIKLLHFDTRAVVKKFYRRGGGEIKNVPTIERKKSLKMGEFANWVPEITNLLTLRDDSGSRFPWPHYCHPVWHC